MDKNQFITGRRTFLLSLGASAGASAIAIASRPKQLNNKAQATRDKNRGFAVIGDAPLRDRAAAKNLIYGAATELHKLSSDLGFANSFAKQCALLVPENALKMGALRPSSDRFDFTEADALLSFSRAHNMLFRGHTLVWGQDFSSWGPEWIRNTVNSQNAEKVLTNHVKTVVGRYAGKIHSWDVLNEALDPSQADGLAKTRWLEFLGPNYIDLAFRTAAAADPQALLVFNDAGFESDTQEGEARRVAVLKLLRHLKSQGTPIHALGIESHLGAPTDVNPRKLRQFLREVASLGLKVLITELDVIDKNLPLNIHVRDRLVAEVYEDYLTVVLDEPAVIAVLTWGLSDRYTWHSSFNPREDKAPVRPLPLDAQLKHKLAWNAIARSFEKAPRR